MDHHQDPLMAIRLQVSLLPAMISSQVIGHHHHIQAMMAVGPLMEGHHLPILGSKLVIHPPSWQVRTHHRHTLGMMAIHHQVATHLRNILATMPVTHLHNIPDTILVTHLHSTHLHSILATTLVTRHHNIHLHNIHLHKSATMVTRRRRTQVMATMVTRHRQPMEVAHLQDMVHLRLAMQVAIHRHMLGTMVQARLDTRIVVIRQPAFMEVPRALHPAAIMVLLRPLHTVGIMVLCLTLVAVSHLQYQAMGSTRFPHSRFTEMVPCRRMADD